jgi:hypothetical protein
MNGPFLNSILYLKLFANIPHQISARNVPNLRKCQGRVDLSADLEEVLQEEGLEWDWPGM